MIELDERLEKELPESVQEIRVFYGKNIEKKE